MRVRPLRAHSPNTCWSRRPAGDERHPSVPQLQRDIGGSAEAGSSATRAAAATRRRTNPSIRIAPENWGRDEFQFLPPISGGKN